MLHPVNVHVGYMLQFNSKYTVLKGIFPRFSPMHCEALCLFWTALQLRNLSITIHIMGQCIINQRPVLISWVALINTSYEWNATELWISDACKTYWVFSNPSQRTSYYALVTSDWFVTSAIILYCRLIGPTVLRCVSQPITAHFLELFISNQNEEERLTSVFLL